MPVLPSDVTIDRLGINSSGTIIVWDDWTNMRHDSPRWEIRLAEDANGVTTWQADNEADKQIILAQYNADTIMTVSGQTVTFMEDRDIEYVLDPNSYARVLRQIKLRTSMRRDTAYAEDSTGKPTLEYEGNWKVAQRTATEDIVSFGQDLQVIRFATGHSVRIDFDVDPPLQSSDTDGIEALDYVRAFVALMNLSRDSGSLTVVGGSALADWSGRTFTIGPSGNTATVSVTHVFLEGVSVGQISWELNITSGNEDQDELTTWFRMQSSTLSNVNQRPEYGGTVSLARVSEARLPSGNILREDAGQLILRGGAGLNIPLGVMAGRRPEVRTFSQVSGGTDYLVTLGPYVQGTYLSGTATANVTARLPAPSASNISNDVVRPFLVDNENDTVTFHIHDWNGNPIVALGPGRSMALQYSLSHDGVGQLRVTNVRPRLTNSHNPDDFGTSYLGTSRTLTYSSQTWYRVPPWSVNLHRDHDAFQIGVASDPFGTDGMEVLHNGEMDIDMRWTAVTSTAGSANKLWTRIFRSRSGTIEPIGRAHKFNNPSQADSPMDDQGVQVRTQALAGDWYTMAARLENDTPSWSLATHFSPANVYARMELWPDIVITES